MHFASTTLTLARSSFNPKVHATYMYIISHTNIFEYACTPKLKLIPFLQVGFHNKLAYFPDYE